MKYLKQKSVYAVLALLLLSIHVTATHNIHDIRNSLKYKNHLEAPLIPNSLMKIVSGEFKGLSADFLLLEISAFINGTGESLTQKDWERISFHFSQTMSLDPYFRQTYQMVQAFLPWNGMPEKANELLEIAKSHLPWDWTPVYYIGFNYFYFMKDNAKAAKYLIEASKMPNAPAMLATLGARLTQETGQTGAAIVFLRTMLHNPEYDREAKRLIQARISLLEQVLVIEKAIAVYEHNFGGKPQKLSDLVTSGILKELPKHKEERDFTYENGKVGY